jgi:subtilase family serine protease
MTVKTACAHPGIPMGAGQLRAAYGSPESPEQGLTGTGTVIAVIIPAAAPHVAADVAVYSARYGLPTPRIRVLTYGNVPRPSGEDAAGWQQEGTMDLEMAHALAPQAQLVYLAVPPSTDDGGTVPENAALDWLVTRYHVDVVSYSEGIPEDYDGQQGHQAIASSRAGLEAAARAGATVVASSGDYGPAEPAGGQLRRSIACAAH